MTSLANSAKNEFTEDELAGIRELRQRLKDFTNEDGDALAKEYINEDTTMWRYVLAQSREDNPMDKSEEMFRSSIAWRKEIQLLSRLVPEWRGGSTSQGADSAPTAATARARLGDLCFYGGLLDAKSTNNGPVLGERIGSVDLAGLYSDDCKWCVVNTFNFFTCLFTR